jgi:predicted lipoprotein
VAKIKQQLVGLHQQIDAFDKPLDEAVLYEKERVKKVYDDAVALNQSISVDLINTLGVTATFSENDGD